MIWGYLILGILFLMSGWFFQKKAYSFYLYSWAAASLIYFVLTRTGFAASGVMEFLVFGFFLTLLCTAFKGFKTIYGKGLLLFSILSFIYVLFYTMQNRNSIPVPTQTGKLIYPDSELVFWMKEIAAFHIGAWIALGLILITIMLFLKAFQMILTEKDKNT